MERYLSNLALYSGVWEFESQRSALRATFFGRHSQMNRKPWFRVKWGVSPLNELELPWLPLQYNCKNPGTGVTNTRYKRKCFHCFRTMILMDEGEIAKVMALPPENGSSTDRDPISRIKVDTWIAVAREFFPNSSKCNRDCRFKYVRFQLWSIFIYLLTRH